MADVLSQSEVESLLAALDPSPDGGTRTAARAGVGPGRQVTLYDFKRPERVSKEQIRAFQALHEGFGREFGASLSSLLRTIVEVKLISVDQLTYGEFVFSLENPTCFTLLHSEGLDGYLIADFNPSIVFPILDRMLGGGKELRQSLPGRALTEIEKRLLTRVTSLAITGLHNAWANLCELKLNVTQIESNPQLVQIVPPNEVIVLVSFEATMGELRGLVNLCLPFNTIEPLAGKLSSDNWTSYKRRTPDLRERKNLETGLSQAAVEVVAQLAATTLSAGEVLGLAIGDVIMTERESRQGLEIFVESRPLFTAWPGLLKGHKAVRIGRTLRRPEEVLGGGAGEKR